MSARPHVGMVWGLYDDGDVDELEKIELPFSVIKEGFDSELWVTLNSHLGLLLDEYEGALVEWSKLDLFVNELTELSRGLSLETATTLDRVASLGRRLRTRGMHMWISM
jgi:hypothetical protein